MTQYLRDAGGTACDGEWDECWVPCAKGDPGAVRFEPVAPITPELRASVGRVVAHIMGLRKYAEDWRRQAPQIAGGKHMIPMHPQASKLLAQADRAMQQADDFAALIAAIPEPESDA